MERTQSNPDLPSSSEIQMEIHMETRYWNPKMVSGLKRLKKQLKIKKAKRASVAVDAPDGPARDLSPSVRAHSVEVDDDDEDDLQHDGWQTPPAGYPLSPKQREQLKTPIFSSDTMLNVNGRYSKHDSFEKGRSISPAPSTSSSEQRHGDSVFGESDAAQVTFDLATLDEGGVTDSSQILSEEGLHKKRSESQLNDETSSVKRSDSRQSSSSEKTKKKSTWYNPFIANYKTKCDDFQRIFSLPQDERLLVDYSCALQREILIQGRLYISQNYICFYANIFRWETLVSIQCKDVRAITKERTARFIPNAIQVCTDNEKYFFTSFGAREKTYLMLFRVWQNALLDQPMSSQKLWQYVHNSYGEELGLTSADNDYVSPHSDEACSPASMGQGEGANSLDFPCLPPPCALDGIQSWLLRGTGLVVTLPSSALFPLLAFVMTSDLERRGGRVRSQESGVRREGPAGLILLRTGLEPDKEEERRLNGLRRSRKVVRSVARVLRRVQSQAFTQPRDPDTRENRNGIEKEDPGMNDVPAEPHPITRGKWSRVTYPLQMRIIEARFGYEDVSKELSEVKGAEMQWKMGEGRSVSWGLGSEEEDEADAGLRLGLGLGLDPAGTPTWPTSVGMSQPDDVPLSSSASSSSASSSLASDPPSPAVSDKDEDVQPPLTRSVDAVSRRVILLPESRGRPSCPSRLGFLESLIPRRLSSPECLVVAGTALSLPAIQVIASDPIEEPVGSPRPGDGGGGDREKEDGKPAYGETDTLSDLGTGSGKKSNRLTPPPPPSTAKKSRKKSSSTSNFEVNTDYSDSTETENDEREISISSPASLLAFIAFSKKKLSQEDSAE
ncbi:unnamed protein product [Darwinula stevensoni]|uniref:GRAM domain-containing protein n=1 Tax=Darwinula stevensoni TaxID=69355 RepID=A0A7R9FP96_9CRUS|nr:unnamed protein product [Darwinula stevensoni]CAG0897317.1 unnamed protein product [Darwinula stevensoni]